LLPLEAPESTGGGVGTSEGAITLSKYEQELEKFKVNEKPESVLLVSGSPHQLRIVVAWTNTRVRTKSKLTERHGSSEMDRWEWLWENAEFCRDELMAKSAVPKDSFEAKLPALIGNRAIYPDGTVNSFVERYLHQRVVRLLQADRDGR
jgi:hypothetical protein